MQVEGEVEVRKEITKDQWRETSELNFKASTAGAGESSATRNAALHKAAFDAGSRGCHLPENGRNAKREANLSR